MALSKFTIWKKKTKNKYPFLDNQDKHNKKPKTYLTFVG